MIGSKSARHGKSREMEPKNLPIWWDEKYMGKQERSVTFFESGDGLLIPYSQGLGIAEVGLLGPYSMAYPLDETCRTTVDTLKASWTEFSRRVGTDTIIRLPPRSHFPELVELNSKALLALGAEIIFEDHNFSIALQGGENGFRRNRIRDANTASKLGMKFSVCPIREAMELIAVNRQAKGRPLSMDTNQALRIDRESPGRISTFGVKLDQSLVSAAITLRVDDRIDYVFMWGHDPSNPLGGKSLSLLAQGLVADSKSAGRSVLCLGVASAEGVRDEGLASFKEGLGAEAEPRLSLRFASLT